MKMNFFVRENILNFPSVRQPDKYSCGVTAAQAVLKYYGIDLSFEELKEKIKPTEKYGTEISSILHTLKQYNLNPISGRMTIDDIEHHVNNKHPVILLIQAWGDKKDYSRTFMSGHFVVAIGYKNNHIIFEDPSLLSSKGKISYKDLMDRWHGIDDDKNHISYFGIAVEGEPNFDPKKIVAIKNDFIPTGVSFIHKDFKNE